MATPLNARQAAALIQEATQRTCSRQNVEQLCQKGRFPRSCLSLRPVRLDAATVVEEYLATVDPVHVNTVSHGPHQKVKRAPKAAKPEASAPVLTGRDDCNLPDYNVSRARTEFEKANLLELDRKTKEGLLLPRDQVERVWGNAVTIARTRLLGVPTRARQRIPHLSLEEVAIVEELIREALEELAEGEGDGE